MNSTKLITCAISGLGIAAVLVGCGGSANNGGTGGTTGTGGVSTGGTPATGGNPGTGGIVSTGGIPGTGGTVSTGGNPGTGGTVSTGGIGGSGGGGHAGGGGGPTGGGGHGGSGMAGSSGGGTSGSAGSSGNFTLTSPDQAEGALFGTTFTCNGMGLGKGMNPELMWSGAPAGTMSYAITFIDTTQGATSAMGQHWAAWNIPASVMDFPKGTMVTSEMLTGALQGASQTNPYLAPCPGGTDMYEFTVYALPVATIDLSSIKFSSPANSAGVASVEKALGAISGGTVLATPLAKATLHGKSNKNGLD